MTRFLSSVPSALPWLGKEERARNGENTKTDSPERETLEFTLSLFCAEGKLRAGGNSLSEQKRRVATPIRKPYRAPGPTHGNVFCDGCMRAVTVHYGCLTLITEWRTGSECRISATGACHTPVSVDTPVM